MECVLQWFDELDDMVASALFVWHRVSAGLLFIGLVCAILVHVAAAHFSGIVSVYLMFELALASIVLWGLGGMLAVAFDRRLRIAS